MEKKYCKNKYYLLFGFQNFGDYLISSETIGLGVSYILDYLHLCWANIFAEIGILAAEIVNLDCKNGFSPLDNP